MDEQKKIEKTYGFLWTRNKDIHPVDIWHFNKMQEVINEPVVRGKIGIDIGCGCGYDTHIMAKNNPSVRLIGMDISDGVYVTRELNAGLKNVNVIKCSAKDIPLKNEVFDFAYSFGVLHHTPDPQKCLLEIWRILKKCSPVFMYLYEDHSENMLKYTAVKIVGYLRVVTARLNPGILYALCYMASPFIFVLFSVPSRILRAFKLTEHFSKSIPFNFGRSLFSLNGDLFDRLSVPIEHRFNRQGVYDLFSGCGFKGIKITRLNESAGWVIRGVKE